MVEHAAVFECSSNGKPLVKNRVNSGKPALAGDPERSSPNENDVGENVQRLGDEDSQPISPTSARHPRLSDSGRVMR